MLKRLVVSIYRITLFSCAVLITFHSVLQINGKLNGLQVGSTSYRPMQRAVQVSSRHNVFLSLKSHTINVFRLQKDRKLFEGTGVILGVTKDGTFILTNNHLCSFAEGELCSVRDDSSNTYIPAIQVKTSKTLDMQVIYIKKLLQDKTPVKGIRSIQEGETIAYVGNGKCYGYLYSEGFVGAFQDSDMIMSSHVFEGYSGSGVFDSEEYLVGLIYASHKFTKEIINPTLGFAVRAEAINQFLSELK